MNLSVAPLFCLQLRDFGEYSRRMAQLQLMQWKRADVALLMVEVERVLTQVEADGSAIPTCRLTADGGARLNTRLAYDLARNDLDWARYRSQLSCSRCSSVRLDSTMALTIPFVTGRS